MAVNLYEQHRPREATITVSLSPDFSGDYVASGAADEVEINAAIVEIAALGGGEVVLGYGDFALTATVNVPVNVFLRGVGWETVLNYNAGGNCITVTGDNVKIRDLKIVTTAGAGVGGTRPNGILADTRTNVEIFGVWHIGDQTVADDGSNVRQCGIVFNAVTNSRILNNRLEDNDRHGINITGSSSNNSLSENVCQGNTENGILIGSSVDNVLCNNICQGNAQRGIRLTSSNNNCLNGNNCQGNTTDGIFLTTASDNNVLGENNCYGNSEDGILIVSSDNNCLNGNNCQGNTRHGVYLSASDNNTLTGTICNGNTENGIYLNDSDSNTLTGNICQGNTQHGIHIDDSDNNIIVGNSCNENDSGDTGSFDGINITDISLDNLVQGNTCNDNDRYGINIDDVRALRNWVKNNQLRGNTSSPFNDNIANLTKLVTKVFQFIQGTTFISAGGSAKGWEINAEADMAVALGHLPLEVQQVVRIKIWAVALDAPGAGGQMHLDLVIQAGVDDLAYTTENISLANFDSVTTDYVNTDVVHWSLDAGDDADISDLVGGMSLECQINGGTAVAPDGATNATFRVLEIEYV